MKHKKWIGLAVIVVGAIVLVIAGWLHLRHGRIFPSTDNAYVGGDIYPVAAAVSRAGSSR